MKNIEEAAIAAKERSLHLSKIKVNLGEHVDKGSLIGEVGSTGRVTGPHLDWRAEWMGRRIDPAYLVNF